MSSNPSLDRLTDQALIDQFSSLVQQDHHHTLALLRHIDVIDARKLWAKYGHPSMFDFCVSRHHMSESTAFERIGAARTARRFPLLFDMVGRGEIHLRGIHRLKAHLTQENHAEVLTEAKHKPIKELEALVARLAPRPDVPSTVRALPERRTKATSAAPVAETLPLPVTSVPRASALPTAPVGSPPAVATPPLRRAPDPEPLSPGRYKLQVTLDEATHQKLKQLQDLLAHKIPTRDPAAIVARALDVLLEQVHKRKTRVTAKPRARKVSSTPRNRWVPAALCREVWTRDQGRCTFEGADGHRCEATSGLEFAHVEPWGKGGEHNAGNLCLRCPAHNAWEADRDYGAGFMATKRSKPWKVRQPVFRPTPRGGPP